MRADRLLTITYLLQQHGLMTSKELSRRLEVSERTIARDMEALSSAGVPVYSERGMNGGWRLSEGYRVQLAGLQKHEIQSLLLMRPSEILEDVGLRQSFDSAFLKLLAAVPASLKQDAEFARQRIHVDGAAWHPSKESFDTLPLLQEAVWASRCLSLHYPKGNELTERVVRPLGLVVKGNTWYLAADTEDGMRSFRVSRIREAFLLDEWFERPAHFDLASYWEQSTASFQSNLPSFPASIRIHEKLLPRLQQASYAEVTDIRPHAEHGWFTAEVRFQVIDSACELILRLGPWAEVLGPEPLRDEVVRRAQAIVDLYKKGSPRD